MDVHITELKNGIIIVSQNHIKLIFKKKKKLVFRI